MFRTLQRHHTATPLAFFLCLLLLWAGSANSVEYIPDPAYNSGTYTYDYFGHGGPPMLENFVGRKSVRLPNGDIVIAGTVPNPGFTDPYEGNPRSLGLVRRNAAGQRVAWSNPGSAAGGNDFVVRPASADGTRVTAVKDLVVWGNNLFVLAESQLNTSYRAMIYVFGTDGSYKAPYQVDSATSSERLVWGGGLAVNQAIGMFPTPDPLLIYIGRKKASPSANERITFRRYSVSSAGTLTAETGLTTLTHTECPSNIHCSAFGIAWGGGIGIGLIPRLYITGARYGSGTWSAYWAQISATDGAISSFRYVGVPGARGRALAVRARYGGSSTDDVFVAAEYDRNCKNGVLVSGRWQPSEPAGYFLNQVIGGFSTSPANPVCHDTLRTTVPVSIAYQNGRVAVAGYSYNRPSGAAEDNNDAWAVVLDADDLAPISPENATNPLLPVLYSWNQSTGMMNRIGHSGFHDIVASDNGTFTATGDVRYPINYEPYTFAGVQRFASLRITEHTELFSDGFEYDGPPLPATSWLYAPQWASASIKVYRSDAGGAYTLVNTASLPAGTNPNSVTFDNSGKLWVLDGKRRLLRYSREQVNTQTSPTVEVTVTPTVSGTGDFFDLAFWGNNAYVSHGFGVNNVYRFTLASLNAGGNPEPAQTFTHSSFNVPAGLAFDAQGQLWISHYSGQRVTRLNVVTGMLGRIIDAVHFNSRASLANPEGMAFDNLGALWVGNNGKPSYTRYSAAILAAASGNNPSEIIGLGAESMTSDPGHVGGVALDAQGDIWLNYQRNAAWMGATGQILERNPLTGVAKQTIDNATTNPGFGGIAFWPIPATLHRGP